MTYFHHAGVIQGLLTPVTLFITHKDFPATSAAIGFPILRIEDRLRGSPAQNIVSTSPRGPVLAPRIRRC